MAKSNLKYLCTFVLVALARGNFVSENPSNSNPVISSPEQSVQTSTRAAFSIRPFRRVEKKQLIVAANEVEEYDDPIPKMVWIPAGLEFTCKERAPGYYTDPSPASKCQVYHMCMPDGRKYSMLCGVGTIFNQITFVCDHWYNYKCSEAERDYKRNDQLWDQFLSPKKEQEYDYEEEPDTTLPSA